MKMQRGVIIIADISGYTNFVKMHAISMLHAEWVLSELMKVLTSSFTPPVTLNKLEGDAALFFAPFKEGEEMAAIEKITKQAILAYQEFKRTRDSFLNSNICICGACLGMKNLTIKIVLCLGDTVEKKLLGKKELSGNVVIIAHRLLKNSIQTHEYILMDNHFYEHAKITFGHEAKMQNEMVDGYGETPVCFFDGEMLDSIIEKLPPSRRSIFRGFYQIFRVQYFMLRRGMGLLKKQAFTNLVAHK
ncbi:DUF2652 domain-containing protein [Dyella sp. M7H15-1]|uniref:DUF2652 domain-containing protein n=1 Tax=Dyella sp. M7H15-1 TaxID=2501295 RepID=UPI001004DF11|nr:DUF2652 domain-containing protein [Dyella sp. M7H15-1]QAU24910.1 DUF2652 domain-containing protein [Dyella sp. M7H15-1]